MDDERRDPAFGELPPPLELTSLFDAPREKNHPVTPAAAQAEAVRWDGRERRTTADAPLRTTTTMPPVAPVRSPRTQEPAKPVANLWPSVRKERERRTAPPPARRRRPDVVQTYRGAVRTVRTVRRVATLAPLLAWALAGLVLIVLLALGTRGGSDDTATATSATTAVVVSPGANSAPQPGVTASRPATPAPRGVVHLDIRVEDAAGASSRETGVVLAGERPLAPSRLRLPLHVTGEVDAGATLTVLVPQPSAGSRLTCTVTATGAVVGTMTRDATSGMLECSTHIADLATGGS